MTNGTTTDAAGYYERRGVLAPAVALWVALTALAHPEAARYFAEVELTVALGALTVATAAAWRERHRVGRAAERDEPWTGPRWEGAVFLTFWLGLFFAAVFLLGVVTAPPLP